MGVDENGVFVRRWEASARRKLVDAYHRLLLLGQSFDLPIRGGDEGESDADDADADAEADVRHLEVEALKLGVVYQHVWIPGDVIIANNRLVAHRAPTVTELEQVSGLRVLHRTVALA